MPFKQVLWFSCTGCLDLEILRSIVINVQVMAQEGYMYRSQLPRMKTILDYYEKSIRLRRDMTGHENQVGLNIATQWRTILVVPILIDLIIEEASKNFKSISILLWWMVYAGR